jgi:hypothetical protein
MASHQTASKMTETPWFLDSYKEMQLLEPCGPSFHTDVYRTWLPFLTNMIHHPTMQLLHWTTRRRLCWWHQLWNASYNNTCIVSLVSQAAYKAQVWAQFIFVCSRWLNLMKCYWFAVSWQFKPTRETIMATITNNPHLKISVTKQWQSAQDVEQVKIRRALDTRCLTLPTRQWQWWTGLLTKRRQETLPMHAQSPTEQRKHKSRFQFNSLTEDGSTLPITCSTDKQCGDMQGTYLPMSSPAWVWTKKQPNQFDQVLELTLAWQCLIFKNTERVGAGKLLFISHREDKTSCVKTRLKEIFGHFDLYT